MYTLFLIERLFFLPVTQNKMGKKMNRSQSSVLLFFFCRSFFVNTAFFKQTPLVKEGGSNMHTEKLKKKEF